MASLFSDFLTVLGVHHTTDYSDRRFRSMPFYSLFGLSKLLNEYGVATRGIKAIDKSSIASLQPPFLADTADGFAIVTKITPQTISYLTQGSQQTAPLSEFVAAWNGIALIAKPGATAHEPGYAAHRTVEIIEKAKRVALTLLGAAAVIALLIYSGIWRNGWSLAIAAIDIVGIYISFLLVQKSLNIKNAKADAVCSVLEEGGCDTIAKSSASSFFGIVKWSEVGLAYFTVSLAALLIWPVEAAPWLALCNALCLPYTVWSIVYQKFVAKTWCTMCVIVQISLWALFFCYLFGGWWSSVGGGVWPLHWHFWALAAAYVMALLGINTLDESLAKYIHPHHDDTNYEDSQDSNSSSAA